MVDESLARTSNTLFDIAFVAYILAMVGYFFRMAFTPVTADGALAGTRAGRNVGLAATVVTMAAVAVHTGSVVLRGLAAGGRVPWANMYEYSSLMALVAVVVGLVVVQRRMGMGHLMGFVLALAVLSMTTALLLFTEAGPVVPALRSWWINVHTSGAMVASSVFMVGFAATALYLVKDTAERRVAGSTSSPQSPADGEQRPEGYEADSGQELRSASPLTQRAVLSPLRFAVMPFAAVGLFTLAVSFDPVAAGIAAGSAALLGSAVRYAVPYLPPAAKLDNLAYRVIAFGFPIWTFAIMAGAIWAEEAWGRYWGWDPKETGSFFTWVLYASYLHARSTRGWRGRRAAWVAVAGFVALMVTYFAVNLWVVGLHSYAGLD